MTDPRNSETPQEPSGFTVTDRRHWVQDSNGDEAEEAQVEERLPTYVEQLKKEAEEKDKRLKEYIQAYKAKIAETDELRQRLQRENESRLEQTRANFFKNTVPILDNLKRAIDAASSAQDFDSFKQGVEMIFDQMKKEFEDQGISIIEAEGKPFDPSLHEAFLTHETDNPALDNMVLEELEPGYLYKEKLIKAAKVKVAKHKPSS